MRIRLSLTLDVDRRRPEPELVEERVSEAYALTERDPFPPSPIGGFQPPEARA